MKSVIIGGVSRSGKSILSRKLSESLKLNVLPVDALVVSLTAGFPQLGINWNEHRQSKERIAPFLRVLICKLAFRSGFSYAFEGDHLTPDLLHDLGPDYPILQGCVPVFLGSQAANQGQKLRALREYSKTNLCYTKHMSDEQVSGLISDLAGESKRLEARCKELGFPYFDTSTDFHAAIDAACVYVSKQV
jgi:hypothetical protein